jgi:integrase
MYFNLKKYNTSGLSYVDDGQIPSSKIKANKIVNTNSIIFEKPYKLHIRASKMLEGKKTIKKKTKTFPITTTLLDAIKDAAKEYDKIMNDIIVDISIPNEVLTPDMKFKDVFLLYVEEKIKEHNNNSAKKPYAELPATRFLNKWLKPIYNMRMNEIFRTHITSLKSKMKDKKGKPLADRTKLTVHQFVNPVYKYFNLNSNYDLKSPGVITKADKIQKNTREFDLSKEDITELFKELKEFKAQPAREIFMWLMHGRRIGEVISISWEDINFDKNTYTIQAKNNKARVAMTYTLSQRLKDTLEAIGIKKSGYVFEKISDKNKNDYYSSSTLRGHWEAFNTNDDMTTRYEMVLHQLRSCIVHYLKNTHNISNELAGFVVGHTQSGTVTERYGTYGFNKLNDTLNLMLDEVFDDDYSVKTPMDDKLKQLQLLFPNKSIEQLEIFLNG